MFSSAFTFNQDLSKWDVSAVTDMAYMFFRASAFNQDLSKWAVSAVTGMESMFHGASAFNRELCGVAWMDSKADKTDMFTNSPGRILSTVCTTARTGYVYGEGCG
jgi:surface protein